MNIGIIGSRSLNKPIPEDVIPENTAKIISGGAVGIDRSAREYALEHKIFIEEILPAYDLYGRRAPLVRNDIIIDKSDAVLIFWDGKSRGTAYVLRECKRKNKPYTLYLWAEGGFIPKED